MERTPKAIYTPEFRLGKLADHGIRVGVHRIPDGHRKLPHLWPGQTPPPEQVAVMHQAIEKRRDDHDVAEQASPVLERTEEPIRPQ